MSKPIESEKIAAFIVSMRKRAGLTQLELAEKLNVTDKAVSKWERGLSLPDISLLSPLSQIFGVTLEELLNGELNEAVADECADDSQNDIENNIKNDVIEYSEKHDVVDIIQDYEHVIQNDTKKTTKSTARYIVEFILTAAMIITILTCLIVDTAINNGVTWAWIPVASVIYGWLVLMPLFVCKKPGFSMLVSLSVCTIPYLGILQMLIPDAKLIFTIGWRESVAGLIYIWCIYAAFVLLKKRTLLAIAVTCLVSVPAVLIINTIPDKYLRGSPENLWNYVSMIILVALSALFFALDRMVHFVRGRDRN